MRPHGWRQGISPGGCNSRWPSGSPSAASRAGSDHCSVRRRGARPATELSIIQSGKLGRRAAAVGADSPLCAWEGGCFAFGSGRASEIGFYSTLPLWRLISQVAEWPVRRCCLASACRPDVALMTAMLTTLLRRFRPSPSPRPATEPGAEISHNVHPQDYAHIARRHLFHPLDRVTVELLLHGDVGHRRGRAAPMPVLLYLARTRSVSRRSPREIRPNVCARPRRSDDSV